MLKTHNTKIKRGEKVMSWLAIAKKNLFEKSEEKNDFLQAVKEFVYIDLIDNQEAQSSCELCNQPNIRYEYLVRNKNNGNELLVGSECIKKFVNELDNINMELLDSNNIVVTEERLESDKKNFFKKITLILINHLWKKNMTEFRSSVINSIENNEALTMNQAKYLKDIYRFGKNRDVRYETAMKNTIKISLKKKTHKYQWKQLKDDEKEFVKLFLSSQQKLSLEQFDLVGF